MIATPHDVLHFASMEFLETSHNGGLVIASFIVALVAGFTGLTLTKDLSSRSVGQRKLAVALASLALGGGIWSMHFVAMLGLQMPILFYYDAAVTLASALVAILIVGIALILLHFTERSPQIIIAAGTLVGIGIVSMHYIGMAGLALCRAVYTPIGIFLAVVVAIALCIAAFWVAYGHRTNRNIVIGTICFGTAVTSVHFAAIAGTRFVEEPSIVEFGPIMSNEVLALGVILSSFVIFGAFLWVGITYLVPQNQSAQPAPERVLDIDARTSEPPSAAMIRIPCEKDGGKIYIAPYEVAIVRADGHYTQVYTEHERLFCSWPITEASRRLIPDGFLKVHRSYLINPDKVAAFERKKDSGKCTFGALDLPHVPVSRSNLKDVQLALGV